jgi:hypothetical protein
MLFACRDVLANPAARAIYDGVVSRATSRDLAQVALAR